MENNPRVEVKLFELDELASKEFKRALTPSNIKVRLRRTRIWQLNVDALINDTSCSQAFVVEGQEAEDLHDQVDAQEDVDWQEDVIVVEVMISLSQGNFYDDEHVCETQFVNEPVVNNMEAATPTKSPTNSACDILMEAIDHENDNANVVSNENVTRIKNDQLSMPTQVTPPSWLVEAMMNNNKHNVSSTNDESMAMPSQPVELSTKLFHYFVDNGSLEEESIHNEVPNEDNNGVQLGSPEVERQVSSHHKHLTMNQTILVRFLKPPVERVKALSTHSATNYLRLERSSQLLTF